ncbi:hypothetical protein JAAARDRAFT_182805 [Jaapia argillacea MUCL 33604]|uniref:Major facilitator superfamily (MFS) profile domain-containing protein n=1 Tax=Jaapia argillacea MUCL 33604 TaxID=933084 RepID=A0A067PFV5_9AGAM|nr:hypothetical protein JAAARDRAFT_182805 [Jaapia argillacea MUCL 33604]
MAASISSSKSALKPEDVQIERTSLPCLEKGISELPTNVDIKKLMWKIDLHVVPVLCMLFLLAFLDRVNISNAALFGLREDLNLSSIQYSTALVIFFVPYVVFEIPSNILVKRLRPHIWLSLCMFFFGLITTLQGLTKTYSQILATRFFLGVFESGMFPACFFILSQWYRREESQKRFTFFFCSTNLAGAFGGLLASAIGEMDGVRGWRGWRWVFVIEGAATCVISIIWFFLIPDFPEAAKFLTEEERAVVTQRLRDDVGHSQEHHRIGMKDILDVFRDYKIFLGGFMYFGLIVPAYGYAYFSPTIIKDFGYGAIESQLRSVPPWACSFVFAMIIASISDHTKHRYLFTLGSALLGMVGYITLVCVHDKAHVHVRYFSLFLSAMGVYTSMPICIGWFNTNLAGHRRRAVGSAWQIGFGNMGGIIAAYIFPSKDGPRYTKGYIICIAFICLSMLASFSYLVGVTAENRRRDQMGGGEKELSGEEEEMLGDLHPAYRYIL